ncbi:hypothetical protein [Myxococcus sp. RHSTA-1-4]|uniref:hypothetical protein n=1 Tax=Myxococcus sp. RHSTA-1-4 TaxID=2874601 RepID=UPI001CBD4668|nr:hypothetical protein [Myxococcus sp. RHSTA-1-4]MBZ4420716.1 hypothetical protein [Myxococcus sp. RHSTA-1-4]
MQLVGTSNDSPSFEVQRLREHVFTRLRPYLSAKNLEGAMRCAARLYTELPDKHALERNTVLVAFGGGKDSSYMLTFVRAIQLILFRVYGGTFRLRVATNRHAGMPRAVMENIHRVYQALGLPEDPLCELLLVDGHEARTFHVDMPVPESLVRRNREDILMTGHRTLADARPTFCNACNLSMVNSFGLAAAHEGGVDLIVTGDSRREQRAYLLWVNRLAQQFELGSASTGRTGFKGFLGTMDNISRAYFQDIHGGHAPEALEERRIEARVREELKFFSIYDDTAYSAGDHWELLTDYLGFEFDEVAFSFTESDCGNPALMAHLRGLKCERLYGRSYEEGIAEYVRFALSLMRQKQFPPQLVETMVARYGDSASVARMRERMDTFARESFGLTPAHLVCMVYSPFADGGSNLQGYLERELPHLAARAPALHALLRDGTPPVPGTEAADLQLELETASGLSLAQLRTLYARPLHPPAAAGERQGLIGAILDRDPHKDTVETRHAPGGPVVKETLSGR